MVVEIFAALNNKDLSPVYKSGVAMKTIGQYFWKRHMRTRDDYVPPKPSEKDTEKDSKTPDAADDADKFDWSAMK